MRLFPRLVKSVINVFVLFCFLCDGFQGHCIAIARSSSGLGIKSEFYKELIIMIYLILCLP